MGRLIYSPFTQSITTANRVIRCLQKFHSFITCPFPNLYRTDFWNSYIQLKALSTMLISKTAPIPKFKKIQSLNMCK